MWLSPSQFPSQSSSSSGRKTEAGIPSASERGKSTGWCCGGNRKDLQPEQFPFLIQGTNWIFREWRRRLPHTCTFLLPHHLAQPGHAHRLRCPNLHLQATATQGQAWGQGPISLPCLLSPSIQTRRKSGRESSGKVSKAEGWWRDTCGPRHMSWLQSIPRSDSRLHKSQKPLHLGWGGPLGRCSLAWGRGGKEGVMESP